MKRVASIPLGDWEALATSRRAAPEATLLAFSAAMQRHGIPSHLVPDVFEALVDAAPTASVSTVTEAEREFALSAGVPEDAFGPDAAASNHLYEMRSALADRSDAAAGLLTTEEVSTLLGITGDNVRQQAQRGSLWSSGQLGSQKAFPAWQFIDGRPLPGLREVIAALPAEFHPLDVAAVMTDPDEALGDRSPREWLATGGPVAPVVTLVSDLSYT